MFIDILTLLGLDYRDASLITLFFVVLGISIKNQIILFDKNVHIQKVKNQQTYWHSCNDYRVATLSKSYQTTAGIIMQSLKSIGQF